MEIDELWQVGKWFAASDLAALRLRTQTWTIEMKRTPALPSLSEQASDTGRAVALSASRSVQIKADAVGVFLARHPLRDNDFAAPGARVEKGGVVGIMQAGVLYHELVAPVDGIVQSVEAGSGALIGWGEPILSLVPSA